jgi:AraC family transcriptional regulator
MEDPLLRLKGLCDYIEDNIAQPLTLGDLEQQSGFSRFQLIRLFKGLCGYPPAEYIRRRRLSLSVRDLYARRRIIDIALDYGFDYEQSYIRAFRSVYGFPPTKLCRSEKEIPLFEKLRVGEARVYTDGFVSEPEVKYLAGVSFRGVEQFYNYRNNTAGESLAAGIRDLKHGIFTGISSPHGQGTFTHRYISCLEGNPANDTTYELPEGRYAVFAYTGLHKLDEAGARGFRTHMLVVTRAWAARNGAVWDWNFVEQVDSEALADDYCEAKVMIPC